jgi:hypothetical protein
MVCSETMAFLGVRSGVAGPPDLRRVQREISEGVRVGAYARRWRYHGLAQEGRPLEARLDITATISIPEVCGSGVRGTDGYASTAEIPWRRKR